MAGRRNWFTGQLVTQQDWRGSDAALEQADRDLCADLLFIGICSGHVVTAQGPASLSLDVSAGLSYSPLGEKMRTSGAAVISTIFDYLGVATACATAGKSKVLSLFIIPDRTPSDPRPDATNTTVYFVQAESYRLVIYQGAEATSNPTPPALIADGILLADITLAYGATSLASGTLSIVRRQDLIVLTGAPFGSGGSGGRYGSCLAALQAIVSRYDGLINGTGDTLAGASMPYGGSGTWVNAVAGIAAGTTESGLDGIVAALASTTTSTSGGDRIGIAADATASPTLAPASLTTRLAALRLASNLGYGGGSAWVNGSTNGAQTVEAILDSIIVDLSSITNSGRGTGAQKIGMRAIGGFTSSSVDGYFFELAATTNGNDGALRIGTHVSTGFVGSNLRTQLNELRAGGTFSGAVVCSSTLAVTGTSALTGAVTCTASLSVGTTLTCTGIATLTGGVVIGGGAISIAAGVTRSGSGGIPDRVSQITASASSATIDTTADTWVFDTPSASGTIPITLKSTSPVPIAGSVIEFEAYTLLIGKSPRLIREDASVIVTFTGSGTGYGHARLKFIAGVWRLCGASGDNFSVTTP